MSGKQCWTWSEATFCGVWSGSTPFAQAFLSQHLELLRYTFVDPCEKTGIFLCSHNEDPDQPAYQYSAAKIL